MPNNRGRQDYATLMQSPCHNPDYGYHDAFFYAYTWRASNVAGHSDHEQFNARLIPSFGESRTKQVS
jgi:hypothetical protein